MTRQHVLVLTTQGPDRAMIEGMLRGDFPDVTVTSAGSREELAQAVLSSEPDTAIAVIDLDWDRSPEVARERRRRFSDCTVLFFKQLDPSDATARTACDLPLDDCVHDGPAGTQRIRAALRSVLRRSAIRRQAAASEERLRLALDGADLCMWEWDTRKGRVTFVGPWEKVCGSLFDGVETAFRDFEDRVHPDDLPRVRAELRFHLEGKTDDYESEYRLRNSSGSWLWVLARGRVVERDAHGEPVRMVATFLDVTQRKTLEDAIRQVAITFSRSSQPGVFSVLVEYLAKTLGADAVLVGDVADGRRWHTLSAWAPGRSMAELDHDIASCSCRGAQTDGIVVCARGAARRFPHDTVLTSMNAEAYVGIRLADVRGQTRGILAAAWLQPLSDTTLPALVMRVFADRAAAEIERLQLAQTLAQRDDQLFHAQKMDALGQLACGVAHDFNNLLQAMLGPLEVLALNSVRPDRKVATVETLQALIDRGAALTRQLLLFSRHEVTRLEKCDLTEVTRGEVRLLRRLLNANVVLSLDLAPSSLPVQADRRQLGQVLMNLVVNGASAMSNGGRLVLRTGGDGAEVWVEVEDFGSGIPEEIRHRIFEPFFTTKPIGEGTGLGLSVVRGIVERHGGNIQVESEVGKGTTIRVTLPRSVTPKLPSTAARPSAPSLPRGGGERVLIVEDEAGARESLQELVELLGYRAVGVENGEAAAALPADPPFDILLSDIELPGMDGEAAAALLREQWPRLCVVMMSGYTEREALRQGLSSLRVRFLAKPIDRSRLAQELRAALDEVGAPWQAPGHGGPGL